MPPAPDLSSLKVENVYDLTNCVIVVTGGNTGIGAMMTSTFVANNARVYVVAIDAADEFQQHYNAEAKKIGSKGSVVVVKGDVSKKSEAKRLAEYVQDKEGYVTALFNNAGVMGKPVERPKESDVKKYVDAYWNLDEQDFDDVTHVNTTGPYFLSIAFLPLLEASKTKAPYGDKFSPVIVNTSSMNGWTKDPSTAGYGYPYLLSKAGIAHLTGLLAHDFLPLGIRVNSIAPGWFISGMTAPEQLDRKTGYSAAQMESGSFGFETPLGGSGGPKDVGSVALALIVARFVTGEHILVDGGTLSVHPSRY